ncbi:MAG: SufD family Fe-S cluster assembly protein [Candidatus Gracilibacteria bacterium]|nr:SufD family Fe-S cluster assembly protein [Candidatus Gracilibacteria bacterium]
MIYTDLNLALNEQNSYVYNDSGNDINITLREGQNLNLFLFVDNEKNVKIKLEKNAKIFLNSLILSNKQAKLNIEIIHKNSNSKSKIYSASLGKTDSKTSVITKIIAGKNLENIETHTNHEHLNLGKNTSVTSLPQMFIETKNIIAGHSSKIENLDKNFNFYLESKGLNNSQIKNLFIISYYNKVFHQMGILDSQYCNNLKNNLLKLI